MVTLDLTASGGSEQTSGEIAYNADGTGGRTSVQGILEVKHAILITEIVIRKGGAAWLSSSAPTDCLLRMCVFVRVCICVCGLCVNACVCFG